jgi:hypothetical protein
MSRYDFFEVFSHFLEIHFKKSFKTQPTGNAKYTQGYAHARAG